MNRYNFDGAPIKLTPEDIADWEKSQINLPDRDITDAERIDALEESIRKGMSL